MSPWIKSHEFIKTKITTNGFSFLKYRNYKVNHTVNGGVRSSYRKESNI